jgi:DNA-binding transcriptional LysR family regulator
MTDVIARTGSSAAAARELGKVPSALTCSVRQLDDALDVLLFDRRSCPIAQWPSLTWPGASRQ